MIDQLAVYGALISCGIFLLASFYARGYVRRLVELHDIEVRELRLFYAAYNLLLIVVVFAFYCNNLALFWILLELTTILSAVLIVTLNAKENIVAALKYVFTASTAMLFSIIGLIILFALTKQATGCRDAKLGCTNAAGRVNVAPAFHLCFCLYFYRVCRQGRYRPVSHLAAQAHAKAPSVISVLLSAVLLNIASLVSSGFMQWHTRPRPGMMSH